MVSASPGLSRPERPLVTFFVTGFNQSDTIDAAMDGALAQTWRPLEVIFSDDASADDTLARMQAKAAAHQGSGDGLSVRVLQAGRNGGIAAHVNRVMAQARGELAVMAGGDDVSEPQRAARLVELWLASGRRAHLLHSDARVIDASGAPVLRRPPPDLLAARRPRDVLALERNVLGAVMAWSREMFEIFGPLPAAAAAEDQPITYRGAFLGPIAYAPEPLVRWRTGGVSWAAPGLLQHPFGPRLRFARWQAGGALCALADLAHAPLDPEEAAACRAIARAKAARFGLEATLGGASWPGRAALAPRAMALAARERRPWPLTLLAKHLLRGPYGRWWERRYGIRLEGPRAARRRRSAS